MKEFNLILSVGKEDIVKKKTPDRSVDIGAEKESWERCRDEITELKEDLFNKIEEKTDCKAMERIVGEIFNFSKTIGRLCPDHSKYITYQILINAEVEYGRAPYFDFPEPHSVKSFLKDLIRSLDEK